MLNLKKKEDVALLKTISDEIFELVRSLGGAISGEHGDGRLRSVYIQSQYPDIFHLFKEVKQLWDPDNILNPDIITGAAQDDGPGEYRFESLRYGTGYAARSPYEPVLFDPSRLVNEIEKCHGCSKCTTVTWATRMCPVYKVLRDEPAAPKAKANILRSLISDSFSVGAGTDNTKQAYARGLFQVLDHCINCGSCSHECPSAVNIPKMVIEAKANFKKRFGIGLSDHLLTSAGTGARLISHFSRVLPEIFENKPLRRLIEKTIGISAKRHLDPFSHKPLKKRVPLLSRQPGKQLLYFAGCYASYIKPDIGEAAVEVFNALGFDVHVPNQYCCGLPMVSKGMTPKACVSIQKNLVQWQDLAARADHIVTTCSSCFLALTEYWPWICAGNQMKLNTAQKGAIGEIKAKVVHFSQLVNDNFSRLNLKQMPMGVAYHTPCHLKGTPQSQSSSAMLASLPGVFVDDLTSHCCGMAGTWGMMAANYGLSRRIGSDLKEKLQKSKASMGSTDCPTCRMQMESFSLKPITHPVEILRNHLRS